MSESLLTPRLERRLTRTHAMLWAVILVATALDVVTTMVGLSMRLQEGNAIARALVDSLGLAGIWLLKFLAMLWLVAGWALLSDRDAAIFLALFAAVTVAVVVSNLLALAGV